MSRYWRHDGSCVITLTPDGLNGVRLAAILQQFGNASVTIGGKVILEGNELRIGSGGGCHQSVDSITVFFSPSATDCAFLRENEIQHITEPGGKRIWPPTFAED